jgi:tRNA(Leu) C34 or U34 (ribose-2'-O)-methylase TrmL
VGSLLRSAEAAGVHGVIFPTHRQAPLSPSAIKASAGAVEHLLLHPAEDLPGTLSDLHGHGVRIVGADGEAPLTARESDLRGAIAIVVGSEGKGLGAAVRRRCDAFMRIPMKGVVGSLNAAVAGSILLFEALAQRDASATRIEKDPDVSAATSPPEEPPPGKVPKSRPRKPAAAATDTPADEDLLPTDAAPRSKRSTRTRPAKPEPEPPPADGDPSSPPDGADA